jgi:5-methylcytosine-specific restriction endonuclease McrA
VRDKTACKNCGASIPPERLKFKARYCNNVCGLRASARRGYARKTKTQKKAMAAKQKLWLNLHPDRVTANRLRVAERIMARKQMLIGVFGQVCWYCGIFLNPDMMQIDHIVPRSRGGTDRPDNFALTCSCCNMAKLGKPLDEFLAWLGFVSARDFSPRILPGMVHPLSNVLGARAEYSESAQRLTVDHGVLREGK